MKVGAGLICVVLLVLTSFFEYGQEGCFRRGVDGIYHSYYVRAHLKTVVPTGRVLLDTPEYIIDTSREEMSEPAVNGVLGILMGASKFGYGRFQWSPVDY